MTTIKMSDNIQEFTGVGTEILTDKYGNPIAEFYNGNFAKSGEVGNTEITVSMIEIKEAA